MKEVQSSGEIPQFASEAEEAEFWATHSLGEAFLDQMEPMPEDVLPPTRPRTQPISLRLDSDVLERARALAEIKNKGYQTLMKEFVVERLYEEEKREGILPTRLTEEAPTPPETTEKQKAAKPRDWQAEAYAFVKENEELLEDPDLDSITLSRLAQNSANRLLEVSEEIKKSSAREGYPATQLRRMRKGYDHLLKFSQRALALYEEKFGKGKLEEEGQQDHSEGAAYRSVIEEAERILQES